MCQVSLDDAAAGDLSDSTTARRACSSAGLRALGDAAMFAVLVCGDVTALCDGVNGVDTPPLLSSLPAAAVHLSLAAAADDLASSWRRHSSFTCTVLSAPAATQIQSTHTS